MHGDNIPLLLILSAVIALETGIDKVALGSVSDVTAPDIEYECGNCIFELSLNNATYQIPYRMVGVIEKAVVNTSAKSLIIEAVISGEPSAALIFLPRDLIDAVELDQNGVVKYSNYTVLLNGVRATSFEIDSSIIDENRELLIYDMSSGLNKIEIIGTWVAPEFKILPLVIVAVAISGLVIWTRSTVRKNDFVGTRTS